MKRRLSLIGCFNKSVILTYLGGICAVTAMGILFLDRETSSMSYLPLSMILLMLSGLCDMVDGYVANICKRDEVQKEFGKHLDSLVDVLSFVVCPIVILCRMEILAHTTFTLIISAVYAVCGINRLAWFGMTEPKGFTEGLPVTYAALFIPWFYALFGWGELIFIPYAVLSVLFSLNFRVKKPNPQMYFVFAVIFVLVAIIILCF